MSGLILYFFWLVLGILCHLTPDAVDKCLGLAKTLSIEIFKAGLR